MQRPLDSKLYGTDRKFITYVDWIPMSLKAESFVDKNFSIGVSINVINYQHIYDAIWTNSSTQKVGIHRFTDIRTRMSILFRSDVYFIRRKMVEGYIGGGAGFAFNKRKYEVLPDGYEFGGSGQSEPIIRFLSHFGLECSMGFRFYPLKEGKLGVLVEGGLMQSYGRFGLSYRF